jgi:hypothetical protein
VVRVYLLSVIYYKIYAFRLVAVVLFLQKCGSAASRFFKHLIYVLWLVNADIRDIQYIPCLSFCLIASLLLIVIVLQTTSDRTYV